MFHIEINGAEMRSSQERSNGCNCLILGVSFFQHQNNARLSSVLMLIVLCKYILLASQE